MSNLRLSLFGLLLLTASQVMAASHAVVFMYHRFGEDQYPSTNIHLEQFDAQLEYLAQHNAQIWRLPRIIEHIQQNKPLPERTLAITIDDAYCSVYEHAWPRLQKYGWPFTVFVNTDPVDSGQADLMTWAQMREMQKTGVHFANHAASHTSLVRSRAEDKASWEQRIRLNINKAQRRLAEELGTTVNAEPQLFAYPYGEYDTATADLLSVMGYIAFGQHSGAIGPLSDLRALPRYPMAEAYAELDGFVQKANSQPLPVLQASPWEPVVSSNNPPTLSLQLQKHLPDLACYNAHGEPLTLNWLDHTNVIIQAKNILPPGRSRYNCTAATGHGNWYWYSHPWLIREAETR